MRSDQHEQHEITKFQCPLKKEGEGENICHLQEHEDPLVEKLHVALRFAVRVLAVLMTCVIFWGIADVVWILYERLLEEPRFLLDINDILATFGAFMAVLIAIEIFANIVMYLQSDIIHIKLVLATALMAAARKVIVLDFKEIDPQHVAAIGVVIIALGISYWLIAKKDESSTD